MLWYYWIGSIVLIPLVTVPVITLVLAFVTTWRWRRRKDRPLFDSALYKGRVSHARFHPTIHAFSYPLFFVCLDLKESSILFGSPSSLLWPLTYVVNFLESDHLKNGEGLWMTKQNEEGTTTTTVQDTTTTTTDKNDTTTTTTTTTTMMEDVDNSLYSRICRLVAERTEGRCKIHCDQRIWLLTHLEYFGYCFNPVSFYYIMERHDETKVQAIVAEVSNTPWLEMYCYVLHPDSVDMEKVQAGRTKSTRDNWFFQQNQNHKQQQQQHNNNPSLHTAIINTTTTTETETTTRNSTYNWESMNYIFQKQFHVSPFMDMNYIYDWTFWHPNRNKIAVSTTMIRRRQQEEEEKKCFNAYFEIERHATLTPMSLYYQILSIPCYCFVIQIWIHIEAFWLFIKGVEFIPHPKGTETTASQIIGTIMIPFFTIQEWWNGSSKETTETTTTTKEKKS